MRKKVLSEEPNRQPQLLDIGPPKPVEPTTKRIRYPIWTENKARLIARYLYYFVLITKHGTYIDAFAGPQDPEKPDTWAAKLVLENEPFWLRKFYLYEKDPKKLDLLQALKVQHLRKGRKIEIAHGDCNSHIQDLLKARRITQKEATFCLLDQHTFECEWSTVEALARYKTQGHKVELFYFLPMAWLDRAEAAQRDRAVIERWWGLSSIEELFRRKGPRRAELFAERFRSELGYASVKPWPIYERQTSGHIMFYMIHATDHPEAPNLMARAYERAVGPKESMEELQTAFEFKG